MHQQVRKVFVIRRLVVGVAWEYKAREERRVCVGGTADGPADSLLHLNVLTLRLTMGGSFPDCTQGIKVGSKDPVF